MNVPASRIRVIQDPPRHAGGYVVYWMIGYRRMARNYALDRAVEWCLELNLPLLVFEAVSCRFPGSSVRFHQFLVGGMRDNQAACRSHNITYVPFLSPGPDADRGLLAALANDAAVVVTDDALINSLPEILKAAARQVSARFEAVDSGGLIPFRKPQRAFHTALSFRRFLQREIPEELASEPSEDALQRAASFGLAPIPESVTAQYVSHPLAFDRLSELPIDLTIGPDPRPGGRTAGLDRLRKFLDEAVSNYGKRGELTDDTHSGLSPYLHFGHIGAHDILAEVSRMGGWMPPLVWPSANGARHGWWNLPKPTEAFLDEAITWRELSINAAAWLPRYSHFDGLPNWALESLRDHQEDTRPWVYELEILESGQTHDRLWNAAQNQLVQEGSIQSYMRMLWGKKILEWTRSPREAFQRMTYLNDTYATDGRDPNSYSGISWVLGRYDHPWVNRPVFGQVRYMSSDSTRKKFKTSNYVDRYAPE